MTTFNEILNDPQKILNIKLKLPKFNIKLPKLKLKRNKGFEKPQRWVILTLAFLIEIFMMFFIFWLFDDRTIFDNDIIKKRSYGHYVTYGWVHRGVISLSLIGAIVWFIIIMSDFMAFDEDDRVLRNFYK